MDENRQEQVEALQALASYTTRFKRSLKSAVKELRDGRRDDTDEFLEKIIQGINWSVQILGSTLSLINENEERIKKEDVNAKMIAFSEAYAAKDDEKLADSLENLIPFFNDLNRIASEY